MAACQFDVVGAGEQQPSTQDAGAPQEQTALAIENDAELLDTYPGERYEVHLRATGGVPSLRWRLETGALPPGIKLEDHGLLFGAADRTGEFQFTVSVTDSGQHTVQKQFLIRVRSAMTLTWKAAAHVSGNRIEGSVDVSNTTPDDIDLTFIVVAVAPNGRATAIGYQHFSLKKGTHEKELPFGETLPHGGYVVHVDAVGEVPPRNLIYHERMQTETLQVTVGP